MTDTRDATSAFVTSRATVSKRAVNKRRARETRDASLRASRGVGVARGPARWRVRLPRASVRPRRRRWRFARRQPRWGTSRPSFDGLACGLPSPSTTRAARSRTCSPRARPAPRSPATACEARRSRTPALRGPARPRRPSPRRRRRSTAPRPRCSERARPPRKPRPPPTRLALFTRPSRSAPSRPPARPRDRAGPRTARRRALCRPNAPRARLDPSAIRPRTSTRRTRRTRRRRRPRRRRTRAAARRRRLAPRRLAPTTTRAFWRLWPPRCARARVRPVSEISGRA